MLRAVFLLHICSNYYIYVVELTKALAASCVYSQRDQRCMISREAGCTRQLLTVGGLPGKGLAWSRSRRAKPGLGRGYSFKTTAQSGWACRRELPHYQTRR